MISRQLARFVVASRFEDIPEPTRRAALRSIVNVVGTALGGSGDEGVERIARAMLPFSGEPQATLIGRAARADIMTAAFLNALAGNVFDFDDTHPETIIHPSAPVAPPLFALAERKAFSGAAFLHAFILGAEIECRLGNAISPRHYARGWHITSTCGIFGAAIACGKILGLDEDAMLAAIGHASAQSAGLVETLGTMAKSTGVGHAARGGMLAALIAREGATGPEMPLEGARAFLPVMGDPHDPSQLTDRLGEEWEIAKNTFKPYPCGVVLNPVIDACLVLRGNSALHLSNIESIIVSGHPLLRQRTDRPDVTTGRQSQVSAQHAVAVTLIDGKAGIPEFSDARVRATDAIAMRTKVRVVDAEEIGVDGARVDIRLRSGKTLSHTIDAARGSLARPLGDDEIEQKFRALSAYGAPKLDPEPLIRALWTLADAKDVARVIRLAAPA